jgi:prepilin peptidase dependent protein B
MTTSRPIRQRGLTLVELMIGLALGLLVAAAATTLLVAQLREQRSLAIENRLMQDLRTASDVIVRDLRRAGHWGAAASGIRVSGSEGAASNPYAALAPGAAASDAASFRYSRDAVENQVVDANEEFGLRLRRGAIELLLGAGNWQSLTDAGTLTVTGLAITPTTQEISLAEHCSAACPTGSTTCPPRQLVRSLAVVVTARAAADTSVVRSLRSEVRVRNDALIGACPV